MTDLLAVLVLALATSAASFTITRTTVTRPFRDFVARHNKWLGRLVQCPYCVSHWLAAGAVAVYQPTPVDLWLPVDLAVAWMLLVAVCAYSVGLIARALEPPPLPAPASPQVIYVNGPPPPASQPDPPKDLRLGPRRADIPRRTT